MVDDYRESRRRRASAARERYNARQKRRETMATLRDQSTHQLSRFNLNVPENGWQQQVWLLVRDSLWYLVYRTPALKIGAFALGIGVLAFFISFLLTDKIYPNIWSLGTPLGGLTRDEAQAALVQAWQENTRVTLVLDQEDFLTVFPEDIGLTLDVQGTVEAAKGAGLSGIPFGTNVQPVIQFDYGIAQNYLLTLTEDVYVPPFEAGYEWRDGELVGVRGRPSRELDITLSLERLSQNPGGIIRDGQMDLLTTSTQPIVVDPLPYLNDAYAFVSQDFRLNGYDPFLNEDIPWTTTREEITRWLAAGSNGLTLRETAFRRFVDAINDSLNVGDQPRYLDTQESVEAVRQAINAGSDTAMLRVRYLPTTYEIAEQDNGFRIGRKTGLPFQLIDEANPGLDWNTLSVGQVINLPSRDDLLPQMPVSHKRIVVDLDRQWMIAYENEEMVFSWAISSGREEAPTYPGTFQILTKEEIAFGSGFSLCNETGCNQWEMYNFMGIYEVTPGLMNGFHGAVLLPNGAYLGGGGVDYPSTFGCVMSENGNSEMLFEWADVGTIVEIVSSEYQPESDLAQQAVAYMQANAF